MFSLDYMIYMGLTAALTAIGAFISNKLKAKFAYYSKMPVSSGKSGAEAAAEMLAHYGVTDVKIVQGQGFLSDHYNPATKTVSLSPEVYAGRHVAAAAVAAHECGHAIQHATAYSMLKMRSSLVPVMKIAAPAQGMLLMGSFMLYTVFPQIILITIAAFSVTALFAFVTLPVEFDASKRALIWLDESGSTHGEEYDGAKDALWWAAMTYVSAALSALVMVVYLVMRMMNSNN